MSESTTAKPASRRARWALYLIGAGVLLLALPVIGGLLLLGQLDQPWLKRLIQRSIRESAPYDVDYGGAKVQPFSGLELTGLTVRSVADEQGVRSLEADIPRLSVRWSLEALLAAGHRVQSVTLEHPRIVWVQADGTSGAPTTEETPPPPLSGLLEKGLSAAPPMDRLELSAMTLQWRRLRDGAVADAFTIEGVGLEMDALPVKEGWSLRGVAGTSAQPLQFSVRREGPQPGQARLQGWLRTELQPSSAAIAFHVRALEQNLAPDIRVDEVMHFEGSAQFDPKASRTKLSIHELRIAADAATLRAELSLPDGSEPIEIADAQSDIDLSKLLSAAPKGLVPATVKSGTLHLRARDAALAGTAVLRGSFSLNAEVAALELPQHGLSLEQGTLQLEVSPGPRGMNGSGVVTVSALELAGKPVLRVPAARVELKAQDVVVDRERLEQGAGHFTVAAELGAIRAAAELTKAGESVRYSVDMRVPRLAELRPYAPVEYGDRIGWGSALAFRSKGVINLQDPKRPMLRQDLELEWQRAKLDHVVAQKLVLALHLDGDPLRGSAHGDLRLTGLELKGHALGSSRLQAHLELDRPRRHLSLDLKSLEGPQVALAGTVAFKRAARAVRLDLDGRLGGLGPWSPLRPLAGMEPLSLDALEVALSLHGDLLGTVLDVKEDSLVLAPNPQRTAVFAGAMEGRVTGLQWKPPKGTELRVDGLSFQSDLGQEGDRRTARARFEADLMALGGAYPAALKGVKGDLELKAAADGTFELSQRARAEAMHQDFAPYYPMRELTLEVKARRNARGVVRLNQVIFDNAAARTHVEMSGAVDWSDLRHRFSLEGELRQDLAHLSETPELFSGKGKLGLAMRVESPDMTVFRTQGTLRFEGADLRRPREGMTVESLDGQVPFVSDWSLKDGVLALTRKRELNAYALLRFSDQHPLQSTSGYLSAARITTPYVTLAPVAANLRIDQRAMSLSQLEMGMRGGRVTGQGVLDWDGADSSLQARIRATGVQSSHGEPFDGNAAIAVSLRERSIDGRADVLRIGNRHLLDLLDLQDPHHTDASINRIRNALSLGYPQNMRVLFNRGFANVRIDFGGLARFLSVDELHGVPLGPLLDRAMVNAARSNRKP